MTSLFGRRLLLLGAAFWFAGGGTASGRDPLEPTADLACQTDLFEGYIPTFRTGDTLPKEGIFAVSLEPAADVIYFVRSNDRPSQGFGGIVTLEGVAAGRYGIILSQEARLSAVQHRPLQPVPIDQGKTSSNCRSLAEITVESGALTLQIFGATTPSIVVVMMRLLD